MKKFIKYFFTMAIIGSMVVFQACGPDEGPDALKPDARFNSTQDATNPLKFTFENVSLNATSYAWDFGDGETSTEENPSHTYAAAKVYTVNLTATGDGGTHQRSAEVDTRTPLNKLAGDGTAPKIWKMVREGNGVRQESKLDTDTEWGLEWSFGDDGNQTFDSRPCMLNNEYSFSTDGTFSFNAGDSYWSEDNMKLSWGCKDVTEADAYKGLNDEDNSAWGSGTHTFEYDVDNDKLKLIGTGAFMGFYFRADSEIGKSKVPVDAIEYSVDQLEDIENGVDTLRITVTQPEDANNKRTRRFRYTFVSYDNAADEPAIPGPPPIPNFDVAVNGLEVTFTNTSELGDSYLWNFGDGETSTDESPVHTYAAEGIYNAILTATNVDGVREKKGDIILGAFNLDFEGDASLSWFTFSDKAISTAKVDNPDASGINTSNTVRELFQGDSVVWWSGMGVFLTEKIDFSTKTSIKMKVYSPEAGKDVRLKLEGDGNKSIIVPTTVANEWEELTFTFDAADSDKFNKLVLYFDFIPAGKKGKENSYYFDDLRLE